MDNSSKEVAGIHQNLRDMLKNFRKKKAKQDQEGQQRDGSAHTLDGESMDPEGALSRRDGIAALERREVVEAVKGDDKVTDFGEGTGRDADLASGPMAGLEAGTGPEKRDEHLALAAGVKRLRPHFTVKTEIEDAPKRQRSITQQEEGLPASPGAGVQNGGLPAAAQVRPSSTPANGFRSSPAGGFAGEDAGGGMAATAPPKLLESRAGARKRVVSLKHIIEDDGSSDLSVPPLSGGTRTPVSSSAVRRSPTGHGFRELGTLRAGQAAAGLQDSLLGAGRGEGLRSSGVDTSKGHQTSQLGQKPPVLKVENLGGPFEELQLRRMLSQTGAVTKLWVERVSMEFCYVSYATREEAAATRVALHGRKWPPSAPKRMVVRYVAPEVMKGGVDAPKTKPPGSSLKRKGASREAPEQGPAGRHSSGVEHLLQQQQRQQLLQQEREQQQQQHLQEEQMEGLPRFLRSQLLRHQQQQQQEHQQQGEEQQLLSLAGREQHEHRHPHQQRQEQERQLGAGLGPSYPYPSPHVNPDFLPTRPAPAPAPADAAAAAAAAVKRTALERLGPPRGRPGPAPPRGFSGDDGLSQEDLIALLHATPYDDRTKESYMYAFGLRGALAAPAADFLAYVGRGESWPATWLEFTAMCEEFDSSSFSAEARLQQMHPPKMMSVLRNLGLVTQQRSVVSWHPAIGLFRDCPTDFVHGGREWAEDFVDVEMCDGELAEDAGPSVAAPDVARGFEHSHPLAAPASQMSQEQHLREAGLTGQHRFRVGAFLAFLARRNRWPTTMEKLRDAFRAFKASPRGASCPGTSFSTLRYLLFKSRVLVTCSRDRFDWSPAAKIFATYPLDVVDQEEELALAGSVGGAGAARGAGLPLGDEPASVPQPAQPAAAEEQAPLLFAGMEDVKELLSSAADRYCDVCNVSFLTSQKLQQHLGGIKHNCRVKLREREEAGGSGSGLGVGQARPLSAPAAAAPRQTGGAGTSGAGHVAGPGGIGTRSPRWQCATCGYAADSQEAFTSHMATIRHAAKAQADCVERLREEEQGASARIAGRSRGDTTRAALAEAGGGEKGRASAPRGSSEGRAAVEAPRRGPLGMQAPLDREGKGYTGRRPREESSSPRVAAEQGNLRSAGEAPAPPLSLQAKESEALKCQLAISTLLPAVQGKPRVVDINATCVETFTVSNEGGAAAAELRSCRPVRAMPEVSLRWNEIGKWSGGECVDPDEPLPLPPGGALTGLMRIIPSSVGLLRNALVFDFGGGVRLVRDFEVFVEDGAVREIQPVSAYAPPKVLPAAEAQGRPVRLVPGVPPRKPPQSVLQALRAASLQTLPEFSIPAELREAFLAHNENENENESGSGSESAGDHRLGELLGPLTMSNYKQRFHTLLYAEEIQMEVDIRSYDMDSVELLPSGSSYLALRVPGAVEKRPALVVGDAVYVGDRRRADQPKETEYEGFIHSVQDETLILRFDRSFHEEVKLLLVQNKGKKEETRPFSASFRVNRTRMRQCHLAVELVGPHMAHVLLPRQLPLSLANLDPPPISPFNPDNNEEQIDAVKEILARSELQEGGEPEPHLPPFLIIGPPGTGKTRTIVEAILQVMRRFPRARLLVCAPSNLAADAILERLTEHRGRRDVCRVNSPQRPKREMRARLLDFCFLASGEAVGEDAFFVPCASKLAPFQCIVTTCVSSVLLHQARLKSDHFTHIFVDEAGQATEPECALPAACFLARSTLLVLAGDDQQLGPVVRAPLARARGLATSFLERLMRAALYAPPRGELALQGYNPLAMTKLVRNYRSHPAILRVPSVCFYREELEPCADARARSSLCAWKELPNQAEFPILFHGVVGLDEREGSSPSYFNTAEASEVKKYISKLMSFRSARVTLQDIGVVTPYRKQMQKIRRLLAGSGMEAVKVGSVEDFQGGERRIVIISTVRSSQALSRFDERHNLGLLRNPRRFNVALTRAMQLLIVVGNPHILAQDEYWAIFLQYCVSHGACVGHPPPALSQTSGEGEEDRLLLAQTALGFGGERFTDAEAEEAEEAAGGPPGRPGVRPSLVGLHEDPEWPDPGL